MRNLFLILALICPSLLAASEDDKAQLDRGLRAYLTKDYAEAVRCFLPLANQGYAPAQTNMATLYKRGLGVPYDEQEALRLYTLAAEQNFGPAQLSLGNLHHAGQCSLTHNDSEARRWYKLASDQGRLPQADFNLARCLDKGDEQDQREAVRLYTRAADQGLAEARNNLGLFYQAGRGGLTKNFDEAQRLYELAAAQGCKPALQNVQTMRNIREKLKTQYGVLVHIP